MIKHFTTAIAGAYLHVWFGDRGIVTLLAMAFVLIGYRIAAESRHDRRPGGDGEDKR